MTPRYILWQAGDTLWHLAGRLLVQSGFTSTASFALAIQAANQDIYAWWAVAANTRIAVPYV